MSELGGPNSGRDSAPERGDTQHPSDRPSAGSDYVGGTATIEKPAEPLTRGEYREQMRLGPAAGADEPAEHIDGADSGPEAPDRIVDRGELAEPLTRDEYREQMRQGPAARAGRPDRDADSVAPDIAADRASGRTEVTEKPRGDQDGQDKADRVRQDSDGMPADVASQTRSRNEAGETVPDVPGKQSRGDGTITHFHSEFKGESLDLYTDGTRWATIDRPQREDTVGIKPDVPDHMPTGKELVEDSGEDASLAEKLRRELYEESDDELDILEKGTNLAHDVFSRQPTGSYESTPASHPYISETPRAPAKSLLVWLTDWAAHVSTGCGVAVLSCGNGWGVLVSSVSRHGVRRVTGGGPRDRGAGRASGKDRGGWCGAGWRCL